MRRRPTHLRRTNVGRVASKSFLRRLTDKYSGAHDAGDADALARARHLREGDEVPRTSRELQLRLVGDAELLALQERWSDAARAFALVDLDAIPAVSRPGILGALAHVLAHSGEDMERAVRRSRSARRRQTHQEISRRGVLVPRAAPRCRALARRRARRSHRASPERDRARGWRATRTRGSVVLHGPLVARGRRPGACLRGLRDRGGPGRALGHACSRLRTRYFGDNTWSCFFRVGFGAGSSK